MNYLVNLDPLTKVWHILKVSIILMNSVGVTSRTSGKLVAALPVGSEETVRRLTEDVDEMVCLRTPPFFAAVGQSYIQFDPVEDEDVLKILKEGRQRKSGEPV